jgi:D-glycerate 3-kinase
MKVPNFKMVLKWRQSQEIKLKKRNQTRKKIMTYKEIKRFVMFYQRITLQMVKDLSKSATIVMFLNKNHQVRKVLYRD